jgi:tetratricopeptide (TPR) repeat protein
VAGLLVAWLASAPALSGADAGPPAPEPAVADMRALEERVRRDPEDFIALNALAERYLRRLAETGDVTWLQRASRAASASLAAVPAELNPTGLNLLAQSAYASHDFAAARDHAERLTRLRPDQAYAWMTLGDALLELGDYDGARDAFQRMGSLGAVGSRARVAAAQRSARLDALHGRVAEARARLEAQIAGAAGQVPAADDAIAVCHAQLGELELAEGDPGAAERHARSALAAAPGMIRAMALLGRARAAQGDLAGAIAPFESAVARVPDPGLLATLSDLHELAGRPGDAARQRVLIAAIARLRTGLHDRQLATYYADHDLEAEAAYAMAAGEYAVRRDIYGADTLAWTALKSGRIDEARRAIAAALRLGTRDARLWYHAGMIARAAGDGASASEYLQRAIELNPAFDPLQASVARRALDPLSGSDSVAPARLVERAADAR